MLDVQQFAVEGSRAFQTSLQTSAVPNDLSRYDTLSLDVKGSLPAARVQLEASGSERWVSAPISATSQWKTHRLELADFQHQIREGGRWMTVDDAAPESVSRIVVNLGEGANAATAQGQLAIDNLKIE